jgi:hypothetical protein
MQQKHPEKEKRWPEVRPDCGAAKEGRCEWTPAEKKKEGYAI